MKVIIDIPQEDYNYNLKHQEVCLLLVAKEHLKKQQEKCRWNEQGMEEWEQIENIIQMIS